MHYQGGKYLISTDIAKIISRGGTTNQMRYQGGKSRIASDIALHVEGGGITK